MTIQLKNLTVEADVEPDRYEITSIRDEAGIEVDATPELLDQIEFALDAEFQAQAYDEAYRDCEMPHLHMALF